MKDILCGPFCPAPCGKISLVPSGEFAGATSAGPEYETLYALGSNCGVDRFDAIIHAEQLCDELGLDTISTGGALSFAMECFERGTIGKEDTDGIELNFGQVEAMMQFIRKIAYREGFGDLLAEGTRRASQKIGGGSESWAIQTKGLELGGFDCRGLFGQALQYALGSRGGCHHDLGIPGLAEIKTGRGKELKGKGQLLKDTLSERIAYDSAILCSFSSRILKMELLAKTLTAISGWEIKEKDLLLIAERIFTLERAFNIREGISRKEDRLPERLSLEVPLDLLLDDFYEVAGWDKNSGIPLPETLKRLELDLKLEKFVPPYSR
jgi:aldehyde:ferredoxin oxidoreductase